MRITQKGQVTIPQHLREQLGLLPHTEVEFVLEGDKLYVCKKEGESRRGYELVEHMRGRSGTGMSTDEITGLTRE